MKKIYSYAKDYLPAAQEVLAAAIDVGVYYLGYTPSGFYELFLKSSICKRFEIGDPFIIWGKSGTEIAFEITAKDIAQYEDILDKTGFKLHRSPEYWAGWSLAYYQWYSSKGFQEINEVISLDDVIHLYIPYHEMDITHFCDKLDNAFTATYPKYNISKD